MDAIKKGSINGSSLLTNPTNPVVDAQSKIIDTDLQQNEKTTLENESEAADAHTPLLSDVLRLREEGNRYYKEGNYVTAIEIYTEGMDLLENGKILYCYRDIYVI